MTDRRFHTPLPASLDGMRMELYQRLQQINDTLALFFVGKGSPEGVVKAKVGAFYQRLDGGAGTAVYVKETGDNTKTGWVAK